MRKDITEINTLIDNDKNINPELFRRQFIKDFKNIKDTIDLYLEFEDIEPKEFYHLIKDLII